MIVLKQNIQLGDMIWCLGNSYRRFKSTESKNILDCTGPEDGDCKLLRNFGHNSPLDVASHQKQHRNETSQVAVLKYFVHTILG